MARTALEAEQTGVTHFRLRPGKRSPFTHRHVEAEEVYVILAGSGRVKLDDEVADVRPLDAIRVAPQVARAFEAGPDGLELLAVRPRTTGRRRARRRPLDRLTYSGSLARARMLRSASRSSAPSALSAGGGVARIASARRASSLPLRVASTTLARRSVGCGRRRTRPWASRSSTTDGRVGRVDPQRRGELAHRHRPARQPAERPRAAEAHAERLGDLAPPLVVEHEVGHQQPDLARASSGAASIARPAYAASASGLSSAAVRRADAVARPRGGQEAEHQHDAAAGGERPPGRVARRRQVPTPPAWDATIAPTTATPSVWPTCREVVAIAAATPAWARGIPDTAAFVIGALTNPKPSPKTTYAASSHAERGRRRRCRSSMRAGASPAQTPAITSGSRGPRRPTMRPDSGDASTVISAIGTVASPACTGE